MDNIIEVNYIDNPAICLKKAQEYYNNYAKMFGNEFAVLQTADILTEKQRRFIQRKKREAKKPITEEQREALRLEKRIRHFAYKEHDKQYSKVYIETHKKEIAKSRNAYYNDNKEAVTVRYKEYAKAKEERRLARLPKQTKQSSS